MDKIVEEKKYNGNINELAIIYGFNDDIVMGGEWYSSFNLMVGDNNG